MNKIIVLAAGKGTRMNSNLPKVLTPLKNRSMISYLLDSIKESNLDNRPILIVSPDNQGIIQESLKFYNLNYVVQKEQLGTGNALFCAKELLLNLNIENIIVFYGDHPFIKPNSMRKIIGNHRGPITMMTTEVIDFNDWRKNFYHWGRIIRDDNEIKEIVEFKDANLKQKEVKEVNPAIFCFNVKWLWENIDKIKNENNQKEYYLTDLIKIAFDQQIKIDSLKIDPLEAIGINSREELEIAEKLVG